jgi:alpha-galactosidase
VWSDYELEMRKSRGDDIEKDKADKIKATGVYYRLMIDHVREVLSDIKRVDPEYDPKQGYKLAGFVWFQGWNDLVNTWTYDKGNQPGGYEMYSQLLEDFIRDVRNDLSAPKLPFVIGVMGVGGMKANNSMKYFREAMAEPASLPEFKGNVAAVQTAPFWDDKLDALFEREQADWPKVNATAKAEHDESWGNKMKIMQDNFTPEEWKYLQGGSAFGYHYLGAAKIMAPIGKAFADAMLKLMHK